MKRPQAPPSIHHILQQTNFIPSNRPLGDAGRGYLHWDELRRREPPEGLTHAQWWMLLKLGRSMARRAIPLPSPHEPGQLWVTLTDAVQERLMQVDRTCAGALGSPSSALLPEDQRRFIVSALREEAIQSSLLEGAATTRAEAKLLLREGRRPRDLGERMVVNNYEAMQHVLSSVQSDLTPDGILELHRILTRDTLHDAGDEGRFQRPGDRRAVVESRPEGETLHIPPPAAEIPAQIDALCALANGQAPEGFLHPVLRAILAHFWLSWLHPFADGNGRTARSLFYRIMLRNGYWMAEYLPISRRLRAAPARYARSFLHAETDELDVTYFVLHQLDVLLATVDDAMAYIERKMAQTRGTEQMLRTRGLLNHRQLALVQHALSHEAPEYTFASHQRSHGVSYPTARGDLLSLQDLGLLHSWKRGRRFVFAPAPGLAERLRGLEPPPPGP